jgi:hypothetical protein
MSTFIFKRINTKLNVLIMKSKTTVISYFHCSLERAFKTPILGDATKIHTGYGFFPEVTHFTDDKTWGKPGGHRMVQVKKNMLYATGFWAKDVTHERKENEYWRWELNDFKQWKMGFKKFIGEWRVVDQKDGTILITYSYTIYSNNLIIFPIHWLFTKSIWNSYMKHAMENIKFLAESEAPLIYQ